MYLVYRLYAEGGLSLKRMKPAASARLRASVKKRLLSLA